MSEYKAAFILSGSEILFLLSAGPPKSPTVPAKQFLKELRTNCIDHQESAQGLVIKRLAQVVDGMITLQPTIQTIACALNQTEALTTINRNGITEYVVCERLVLHISPYTHIPESWKITPYPDEAILSAAIGPYETISRTKAGRKNG